MPKGPAEYTTAAITVWRPARANSVFGMFGVGRLAGASRVHHRGNYGAGPWPLVILGCTSDFDILVGAGRAHYRGDHGTAPSPQECLVPGLHNLILTGCGHGTD